MDRNFKCFQVGGIKLFLKKEVQFKKKQYIIWSRYDGDGADEDDVS